MSPRQDFLQQSLERLGIKTGLDTIFAPSCYITSYHIYTSDHFTIFFSFDKDPAVYTYTYRHRIQQTSSSLLLGVVTIKKPSDTPVVWTEIILVTRKVQIYDSMATKVFTDILVTISLPWPSYLCYESLLRLPVGLVTRLR